MVSLSHPYKSHLISADTEWWYHECVLSKMLQNCKKVLHYGRVWMNLWDEKMSILVVSNLFCPTHALSYVLHTDILVWPENNSNYFS